MGFCFLFLLIGKALFSFTIFSCSLGRNIFSCSLRGHYFLLLIGKALFSLVHCEGTIFFCSLGRHYFLLFIERALFSFAHWKGTIFSCSLGRHYFLSLIGKTLFSFTHWEGTIFSCSLRRHYFPFLIGKALFSLVNWKRTIFFCSLTILYLWWTTSGVWILNCATPSSRLNLSCKLYTEDVLLFWPTTQANSYIIKTCTIKGKCIVLIVTRYGINIHTQSKNDVVDISKNFSSQPDANFNLCQVKRSRLKNGRRQLDTLKKWSKLSFTVFSTKQKIHCNNSPWDTMTNKHANISPHHKKAINCWVIIIN